MDHFALLLGYLDKQLALVTKLYEEIIQTDLSVYDKRFVFALKTQQFYTALEDIFKQIAKAFENHIDHLESFHKELLLRMTIQIPQIRPALLSTKSLLLLDKIRAFRHFIRHAYDCELDEQEMQHLQGRLKQEFLFVEQDFKQFRSFIQELCR